MEDTKNFGDDRTDGWARDTPKQRIKNAKIAIKVLKEELKVRELQLKVTQAEADIRKLEAG